MAGPPGAALADSAVPYNQKEGHLRSKLRTVSAGHVAVLVVEEAAGHVAKRVRKSDKSLLSIFIKIHRKSLKVLFEEIPVRQ